MQKQQTGSYWVWIPRYEYQIDYVTNGVEQGINTDETKAGTIDVNFISTSTTTATAGYTIHPAFASDVNTGGWGSEIPGIWVAKFEMSMETSGVATNPTNSTAGNIATNATVKVVSKPRSEFLEIYKYSKLL